ncbi:BZ3500_MvSof-1268-A1-R1_Chr1-3g01683 [Microbotryum saponariae]|uniref:BZ3500_MvSof-1268-A1-R1_Chr1-3g01683 protein n=1 Tax=Microbotryum saponariae TaxID=289078 RepID=A0A2X0L6A6_9BASI|nr:BZ3500_MvSof-1268-A1-R1_Chr1-3g01683 [Microbotryum saponariae]SCZ94311.1 BZ3501_MvSof-1269-A2-R1_Chr1-3g01284 [Microbotryum saponariae]
MAGAFSGTSDLVVLGCATALLLFILRRQRVANRHLPPSPAGALPFLGHMFVLPKRQPWFKMEQWTRELGPIYSIKLGSQLFVILGRASAAVDLLDKRSRIYSSRPHRIMISDIASRGYRMVLMPYGDRWRKQRRLLHPITNIKASSCYEGIQSMESAQLVRDLLRDPQNFMNHAQRQVYLSRAQSWDDPAITKMAEIGSYLGPLAVIGSSIVDIWPCLNRLPRFLAPWKKRGDELFNMSYTLYRRHYDDVKREVQQGGAPVSFAADIIRLRQEYKISEIEGMFLAGSIYAAGSITTSDATETFILLMVAHPEVLIKAQEEIDRVVGCKRLPEFSDQDDLVYCQAILRECMRFRSVTAGGVTHCTMEDDTYNGYFIPKGTAVLACHWAIHLDPEVYPEPHKFNPDRFVVDGELVGTKYSERGHHTYGFGRRICPGMHIADRSLFIAFTRIMWACELLPQIDDEGNAIPVDVNRFTDGLATAPLPFQCRIQSRGKWVEEALDSFAF